MSYSYDRRAAALPTPAFTRMVSAIGDTARAMELQVQRLGGVEAALQRGHGDTLRQQLHDIQSSARVLQRRLGFE